MSEYAVQAAIAAGQIQSWPKIKQQAGMPRSAEEVSRRKGLPSEAGSLYYIVNVVTPDGVSEELWF